MEGCNEELILLLRPSSHNFQIESPNSPLKAIPSEHPSLDLNLSISIGSLGSSSNDGAKSDTKGSKAIKQQTVEQIRLAAVEEAYAERVRELTRRELELAEKEFARARLVWERAKEEVEKVERLKEMAAKRISSTCLEITCQSCRQRFRP